jgi:hypothetical protein
MSDRSRSMKPAKPDVNDSFSVDGTITVFGDKVIVVSSAPKSDPPSTDRIRLYSILGTTFDSSDTEKIRIY